MIKPWPEYLKLNNGRDYCILQLEHNGEERFDLIVTYKMLGDSGYHLPITIGEFGKRMVVGEGILSIPTTTDITLYLTKGGGRQPVEEQT